MEVLKKTLSILFISLTSLSPFPVFAQSSQTDSVTITTYYPSPHGVYRNLRLYPVSEPACSVSQEGLMYYNNIAHGLNLCSYNGMGYNWTIIAGGGGSSFWAENAANHNINNTNSGQFVGIGTTTPTEKLTVVGGNITVVNGDVCLSPSGICLSQLQVLPLGSKYITTREVSFQYQVQSGQTTYWYNNQYNINPPLCPSQPSNPVYFRCFGSSTGTCVQVCVK